MDRSRLRDENNSFFFDGDEEDLPTPLPSLVWMVNGRMKKTEKGQQDTSFWVAGSAGFDAND